MRCYYEVLGVQKDVCEEELRKSYRRLALQLHPDKNPDNAEEAKVKFQEIQSAYEVLSDPHERAFYDRNRESILHGDELESERKEEIHLFKYFTTSCFSGFNDSDTGFYTVYRRAFEFIAAKDLKYIDDDDDIIIPNFGRSDTLLEDVAQFYGYWQSYCTSMSFSWFDKYDIRQAPNRWVEKRVERENKKLRDKAKKEFNEEVRSLVAFARKRDKRWEARKKQLEDKVAENARKQLEFQRKQREERQKWIEEIMEEQKESLSQYERQLKQMESQHAEEWNVSDDSISDTEVEDKEDLDLMMEGLYCIACEKLFKSDKAFQNHEQSRKHQEKQSALAELMKDEEAAYVNEKNLDNKEIDLSISSEDDTDVAVLSSKKKKKKKKQNKNFEEVVISESKSRKKSSRKQKQSLDVAFADLKLNAASDGDVDSSISLEQCEKEVKEQCSEALEINNDKTPLSEDLKQPKLKGKKAKDARKKLQLQQQQQQQQNNEVKVDVCIICNEKFDSKNKLFTHLKVTGHAAPKVANSKSKANR